MTRTRAAFAAVLLSAALMACSDDDDDETPPATEPGAEEGMGDVDPPAAAFLDGIVRLDGGTRNAAEAIAELEAAIDENENLGLVASVDHAANAETVDETLPPTGVALFGNPRLGTPLMLASRTAGLDLPQRLLAFEGAADGVAETGDAGGAVESLTILWNDPAWIAARHGIEGEDMAIETISGALAALGGRASGGEGEPVADADITTEADAGIVRVTSERDFETTVAALRDAIVGAGPLTLVEELDHAANAARVDLELPPTRLFVFGNPALGTPLMRSMRTIGLDLPQKMLVWEEGDAVTIAWNDPVWLAARHGVAGRDELLERISGALAGLANAAAGTADGG